MGAGLNVIIFDDLEWPLTRMSRSQHFLKSNIGKTPRLKDKVLCTAQRTYWRGFILYTWRKAGRTIFETFSRIVC